MADPSTPSGADRRESPRVPMRFLVRDAAEGGSFEECDGDLSVGGALIHARHPPTGSMYEVRFHLPGIEKDCRCKAELLRVRDEGPTGKGYHLRFVELPVSLELAIARYLDDMAAGAPR